MEFSLSYQVSFPIGLERETAYLSQELRNQYQEFFNWVQAGEKPEIPEHDLPLYNKGNVPIDLNNPVQTSQESSEPWLLGNWDIEYFYGLSRPIDTTCACPYGWVQKVERVIDQQYPIFGVERFPYLPAKAAHIAWLVLKNEIFPEYNAGIAVLAVLVLLKHNKLNVIPNDEDLMRFITVMRKYIQKVEIEELEEDDVIWWLSMIVKGWEK